MAVSVVRGLRGQLLGVVLLTLGAALAAVAAYDASTEDVLVEEVRQAVEALTEAVEVSVQQLGATTEPDEALLRDYARRLGPAGVREITVLSPDKTRRAGSHAFLIEEVPRRGDRSTFDLLVPIVVGADKLGYVQLRMTSRDVEQRLEQIRLHRTWIVLAVFAVGMGLAAWMVHRITRPVEALRQASLRIGAGVFDAPLPAASGDEVGDLVRAFGTMTAGLAERDELRRRLADQERDVILGRMAASVAHDVRNPLNYLSLAVDHLVSSAPGAEAIGARMKAEIARASDRIGELLRLGKPLELHREEVEVRTLLEAVASSTGGAPDRVRVEAADGGRAEWDPSVIEGLLRNLVVNALQASTETGEVVLRARSEEDRVIIDVEDRGSGVPPAVLEHLFEPYFTTKPEGVGLGLVLARRAAREHGGELSAAPREGGGACFTVTLPRRAPAPRTSLAPGGPA